MAIPALFFPRFHQAFLATRPNLDVLFLADGLEAEASGRLVAPVAQGDMTLLDYIITGFPVSVSEMQRSVGQMQQMARDMADSGNLSQLFQVDTEKQKEQAARRQEYEDLRVFGTEAEGARIASQSLRDDVFGFTALQAQTVIFLVNALECTILEARQITNRQKLIEETLFEDLHSPSEEFDSVFSDLQPIENPACSWQTVLKALAPFLPEHAVFYSDDATFIEDLRELFPELFTLGSGVHGSERALTFNFQQIPDLANSKTGCKKITVYIPIQCS